MTDFITTSVAMTPPPMFPSTVNVGGVSIELRADGSWSGDADKFIAALKLAKHGNYILDVGCGATHKGSDRPATGATSEMEVRRG